MAATFGILLNRYRRQSGISLAELALLAGLDEATLAAIEEGEDRSPPIETVRMAADALALDAERTAALLAARADTGPDARAVDPAVHLPQTTTLIGREAEIATIISLLRADGIRLLTLTGPGGTGKTRLALAAADRLRRDDQPRDGVHFVDLTSTADPALVPRAIARALGVPVAERPVAAVLADYLRPKRLVLILDNFEQVIEAATTLGALLADAPNLKVLVTSRERLRIAAEHVHQVPPLPLRRPNPGETEPGTALSDAGRLFADRARAASSDFTLTPATAEAIEGICQRVDGLPLGIELAAARVAMFPPAALRARMDRSLPVLTRGPRDAPPRLRSMRDAIAWSYDLLDEPERRLFRLLAVFSGGWSLEAATLVGHEHIGNAMGGNADILVDGLASLVEKSLVQMTAGEGDDVRYAMLQTVREFGLERLELAGESGAAFGAHFRYVQDLVVRAETALHGREQALWLDRLELEFPNIRAAVIWAGEHDAAEDGARIVVRLWRFWMMRRQAAEGRELLTRLLGQRGRFSNDALAEALITGSALAQFQGDYEPAMAMAEEGLVLARACGHALAEARALGEIGSTLKVQGRLVESADYLKSSLALHEALGNTPWVATVTYTLADALRDLEAIEESRTLLDSALATARHFGDVWNVAWVLNFLADMERAAGDFERSLHLDQEGLTLHHELKDTWGIIGAITGLACVAYAWDQSIRATRLLGARRALREALGMPHVWPMHRHWYDPMVDELRRKLGETRFQATWDEGATLSIDQVIAEGLAISVHDAPGGDPRHTGAAGLFSSRELEVLKLVVQGQSDREIADALFISRRTASNHVANIMNKIGVSSRVAVATFAVRNGLD